MARKKLESSARAKLTKKNAKHTTDSDIDYSDIPELSDQQLRSMKRVGRPPFGAASKRLIAIRIDPEILEKIRKLANTTGKGYQTLINEILEQYTKKRAA